MRDFAADPWSTTVPDSQGDWFDFLYTGGSLVNVYQLTEDEDGDLVKGSSRDFGIDVLARGMVGKATAEWLFTLTAEWIEDRNKALADGVIRAGE